MTRPRKENRGYSPSGQDPPARSCLPLFCADGGRMRRQQRQFDTTSSTGGGASLSGEIAGAGSSAQQAAQEAWIAGFQSANPDVSIAYDPVGSGGGREQFVAGGTAYGGSDSALADEELTGAQQRCGGENNLVEIPAYVSPIAVIYNLDGVDVPQARPRHAGEHLRRRRSPSGTTRRSRRQPGRHTSGHAHHPRQPLRRVGHDRELHRLPVSGRARASGRSRSAATGPSRAARPPREPRASSTRSRTARARSATPTRARPATWESPKIQVGTEFVGADRRGGGEDLRRVASRAATPARTSSRSS